MRRSVAVSDASQILGLTSNDRLLLQVLSSFDGHWALRTHFEVLRALQAYCYSLARVARVAILSLERESS
jgi:hypothetical protein